MYAPRSLLQFYCFFTFILYCVAVRLPNYSTDLGITLNEITVYTSLVEYEDDVSKFTDEQLVGLARQGESLYPTVEVQEASKLETSAGLVRDFTC
jgi:hypothetical protein